MTEFVYVHRGMVGERDTRHEAIGDLAKHGEWEPGAVTPIAEDCLVRPLYSMTVGPIHLGDKYWGDRDWLATKHGAVELHCEELIRFVDGNEQDVVETEWYADCPICGHCVSVDGSGEAARSDLIDQLLEHCGTEWYPPSDWVADCEICGEDHRGEYGCQPPALRTPFPGVDEDYACARCGWDGHGEDLMAPNGECPHCDSSAVKIAQ